MNKTSNYQLNQWELTDRIRMEDFNGDNEKIDAALAGLAGQVASKADSSTVSSLTTKVNAKAAQSDLTAAVSRITALESGKAEKTALAAEQTARENADNAEKAAREAADAALGVRIDDLTPKAGAQFIRTVTLEESGSFVYLNLGEIDWDQWKAVHLSLDVYTANGNGATVVFGTDNAGSVSSNSTPPDNSESRYLNHVLLYPLFDKRRYVCPIVMGYSGTAFNRCFTRFSDLTSISLRGMSTEVLAGTKCDIWGEK